MNDPEAQAELIRLIRNASEEQLNEAANACFGAGHPGITPGEVDAPPPAARPTARPAPARPAAAAPAPQQP